jgi:hypothetical protein
MKRLFPFFLFMLVLAGCEEGCPPISYTSNEDMDRNKFIGTWQYVYSILKCDQYEPQGSHTYIFDTVYPQEVVPWLNAPVSTHTFIINDVLTIVKNREPSIYCIEHWSQESFNQSNINLRDRLTIYCGNLFYTLNSFDTLVIDTLVIGPAFEQHLPCESDTYSTTDYYIRIQ